MTTDNRVTVKIKLTPELREKISKQATAHAVRMGEVIEVLMRESFGMEPTEVVVTDRRIVAPGELK